MSDLIRIAGFTFLATLFVLNFPVIAVVLAVIAMWRLYPAKEG